MVIMVNRIERLSLFGIVVFLFVALGVRPQTDRLTWGLENMPVMIGLPLLPCTGRRFPLTRLTCWLLAVHAIILMVGGYYSYAEVPLFHHLKDVFGWERNNYDRLGHLAQGFIPAILAREILLRSTALQPGKMLAFLVLSICMFVSSVYELFEWGSAIAFGDGSQAFLGTQGDVWDAQADMFCALVGSLLSQFLFSKIHDRQIQSLTRVRRVRCRT